MKSWQRLLRKLLLPISGVYYMVMGMRNLLYDIRIFKTHKVACSVIAVGNISVGGTGKTPMTEYIARYLHAQGRKTAVLSRGYRRKTKGYVLAKDYTQTYHHGETIGDEPTQYTLSLPHSAVAVCEKRVIGANTLIETLQPEVIILDDAFQHRAIHRDLNIVLIDSYHLPWKDFVLPAGDLRESYMAIERADVVIITKLSFSETVEKTIKGILNDIEKINPKLPVLLSSFLPTTLVSVSKPTQTLALETLTGKKVFAVCGIGNPDYFIAQLEELNAEVPTVLTLRDHRTFDEDILNTLAQEIESLKPDYIICTEKDFCRFRYTDAYKTLSQYTNFYFLRIEVAFWNEDEKRFGELIAAKLK